MKKKYLLFLYIIFVFSAQTKAQLTSLNENFNSCPVGEHGPSSWLVYNSIISTMPDGEWTCDPSYGRDGSPGISCTGYYGTPMATTHLDTSLLISPELDLRSYPGPVYVNFDTKTTKFMLGAKLQVLTSNGSTFGATDSVNITAERHIFDASDSSNWVTHQADLTQYKNTPHFYIGFRFMSDVSTTAASRWYLDNIRTTTSYLGVTAPEYDAQFLKILGIPAPDVINISCNVHSGGIYNLSVYDMVGRQLYCEQRFLQAGNSTLKVSDLHLMAGMYMMKMSNESWNAVTKVIVR